LMRTYKVTNRPPSVNDTPHPPAIGVGASVLSSTIVRTLLIAKPPLRWKKSPLEKGERFRASEESDAIA